MTNVSQSFTIFTSKDINIGAFGAQADTGQIQKRVTWDAKNYSLAKATLTLKANQSYASGAGVYALLNQNQIPGLTWGAFDTTDHDNTQDVSAYLVNGNNIFVVWYKTAFPLLPFTQATATISLTLDVTFTYIGTGTPSNNPSSAGIGIPTWSQISQDIHNFFSNTINLVVAAVLVVIVVLGLWAVISAYTGGGTGKLTSAFTGLREDLQKLGSSVKSKAGETKGKLDVELAERERARMEGKR